MIVLPWWQKRPLFHYWVVSFVVSRLNLGRLLRIFIQALAFVLLRDLVGQYPLVDNALGIYAHAID